MATLEKREQTPGKVTYRVRWWADGKQRSKSFKAQADARRWKAVLEGDLVNGSYIDPKSGAQTLSGFAETALDSLTIDVRATTKARIESVYRVHIAPEFGHLPLTAITGAGVSAWVLRKKQEQAAASVRKAAHVLTRLLGLAVDQGLIKANPASSVRLPVEAKNEQRFLTQAQAMTLADSIHPRFKAMVLVAVFGGLRFGELAGLQRKHINPLTNTVNVRQTLIEVGSTATFGPPKTRTSVRTVTLPRSIMAALVDHMESHTETDPDAVVFTGERGTTLRRAWFNRYYYRPATTKAGLAGLRFHDLRHTFVALWVSLGRNPKEVSKAAGHCSVAFTLDRYGHLYDIDHDGLADELDALLGHVDVS
jgi:integrase